MDEFDIKAISFMEEYLDNGDGSDYD